MISKIDSYFSTWAQLIPDSIDLSGTCGSDQLSRREICFGSSCVFMLFFPTFSGCIPKIGGWMMFELPREYLRHNQFCCFFLPIYLCSWKDLKRSPTLVGAKMNYQLTGRTDLFVLVAGCGLRRRLRAPCKKPRAASVGTTVVKSCWQTDVM